MSSAYAYGKSEDSLKAVEKVSDILEEIERLYREAAQIADNHNVHFSYDGPSGYGDGGYYNPDDGWLASSQSC